MPEKTAPEERSASFREMPRTRQTLSVSQMRVLLNALMRTPVGVVQQVGFLLMLFVALVEASLPDTSAPPTASIAVRDVAATAHDHVAVTTDEKEWSAKLSAFAKVKQARGERLMGKGGTVKVRPKGVPNVKVETLRRWAVRRNKKMPSLLRLLQATPEIGTKNALLIQYHAGGISRREAGKVTEEHACSVSKDKAVPFRKLANIHIPDIWKKSPSKRAKYTHKKTTSKYVLSLKRASRFLNVEKLNLKIRSLQRSIAFIVNIYLQEKRSYGGLYS